MIKSNKGFTLMEAIVVTGILAFITAAMYGMVTTGRRSWLVGEVLVGTQQSARNALDRITRELRHSAASHVTINNTLFADAVDSVRFDVPIDADGNGFIDLIPGSSMIVYGAENNPDWEIEFQLDAANEQIIRRVLDNTGTEQSRQIVANNIRTLNFQNETGGTNVPQQAVNISLTATIDTIQGRTINPPIQTTLSTRINLRN
jgi:Tfp pilus assembly protein PilW